MPTPIRIGSSGPMSHAATRTPRQTARTTPIAAVARLPKPLITEDIPHRAHRCRGSRATLPSVFTPNVAPELLPHPALGLTPFVLQVAGGIPTSNLNLGRLTPQNTTTVTDERDEAGDNDQSE